MVSEKKLNVQMSTNNDGQQKTAIGHPSDSGDLKSNEIIYDTVLYEIFLIMLEFGAKHPWVKRLFRS